MSIYSTFWNIQIPVHLPDKPCARNPRDGFVKEMCSEKWFEVWAQGVRGHIKYEVDWLPPPIEDDDGVRCVVFCENSTPKEGQQYINPLKVLTGEEYYGMHMGDIIGILEEILEERHWPRRGHKQK